jgi:hypothetical protein
MFGTASVGGTYAATTRVWDVSLGLLLATCETGLVPWAARL